MINTKNNINCCKIKKNKEKKRRENKQGYSKKSIIECRKKVISIFIRGISLL